MNGNRAVGLALAALLASCTATADPAPTTTTTAVAVDTVPDPTTTTTTAEDEPVDICARGMVWEPGTTYTAECFFVPVAFRPDTEGWRSFGGNLRAVHVELWDEEGAVVGIQLLGFEPALPPADVLDLILEVDRVEGITAPRPAGLSSWPGVIADIRTEPDASPARPTQEPEECSRTGFALKWFYDAMPGYPLVIEFPREYGLGACYHFRVWVLDIGGESMTVTAVVFDPDRFDELVGHAEALLATMTLAS